jgi:hypothetical protein
MKEGYMKKSLNEVMDEAQEDMKKEYERFNPNPFVGSARSAKDATTEAVQSLAETNLIQAIRIRNLEAMISGMTEAMRPMLEEWQKLKNKTQ